MPRFVFKLDPLLRKYEREEGEIRKRVAEVERQQVDLENQIRSAQGAIVAGKQEMSDRLLNAVDTHAIRAQAAMTIRLDQGIRRLALRLAEAMRRREMVQRELLEAVKRRKAIETLRERRYEAWLTDLERKEQADLDDVIMSRVKRNEDEA